MAQDAAAAGEPEGLIAWGALLLGRRRRLLVLSASLAVITLVVGLLLPRTYSARGAFTPQVSTSPLSRLAGLAAQFGVGNLPGNDQTASPDFYADLVRSEQLRRALVTTEYVVVQGRDTVRGTLVDFYRINERTPALAREVAVKKLVGDLSVSVNVRTGVVELEARARWPGLALQLVEQTLARLNQFNLETRQSQAASERKFAEISVVQAKNDLREAEDRMQQFLTQNREFRNSPQLTFQNERLQREVDTRQQVYTSLVQSYEQARIEEVRNTPVITVVEAPILPVKPESRLLAFKIVIAMTLGLLLGIGWTLAEDFMSRNRVVDPDGSEQLSMLWRQTKSDLRRPWRLFRRSEDGPTSP